MNRAIDRCPYCGGPVSPYQRFCDTCGTPLTAVGAAPPPSPAHFARARQQSGSGMTGCCIAAVLSFLVVFCFGLTLAALTASLIGSTISFGP